jgi:CspA family cold shock protein
VVLFFCFLVFFNNSANNLLYLRFINLLFITMEGTVKFFNESKGYGFITNDETGKDIFVHASGLNGEALNEGDRVEYVEEEGRKGVIAAKVRVIHD